MSMATALKYNEHPAAALLSVWAQLERLDVDVVGIMGNDDHTYGWHLSAVRLIGTGHEDDKSLRGLNLPIVDDHAACAIDIAHDWPASGEWLEDVRRRCELGELDQVSELIGDPDLIPGAPRDIQDACYAAPSTGWRWVEYRGQGHVTWCHVGIWRRCANDEQLGAELLGNWSRDGRNDDEDLEDEDMKLTDRFVLDYIDEGTGELKHIPIDYRQYLSLRYVQKQRALMLARGDQEAEARHAAAEIAMLEKLYAAELADDEPKPV